MGVRYREQHPAAFELFESFKGGNFVSHLRAWPPRGPGRGLNLSMRLELPGMIFFFSFCFFRKAKAKWRHQGDNATWRSVHVQVKDNLPGLRNHGALYYCHAIIDIGKPKPTNTYNFLNPQEKKKTPHSTFCRHISFLFFPLKAPSAGLSNLFLIV